MTDACQIKLDNNINRIIDAISSDKELFPPNNRLRNPCSICNRNCLKNQAQLHCTSCNKNCHRVCDGTSLEKYNLIL